MSSAQHPMKKLGKFEIISKVGQGAMGVVWKARQTSLKRDVALKLIRAGALAGPDEVRLVGAGLSDVKAARPAAGYLVEWDLPEGLDMESYLARKKANSPMYAKVPEVSFLRTYVREDMVKCLCLYDGPGEQSVLRAREAVETPVDRLHTLDRGAEGR